MIKFNKKYIFIFLFIIIFSLFFLYLNKNNENKILSIYFNNTDITSNYVNINSLSDTTPLVRTIYTEYGYNTFEIYKNKIACIESDCKNQICKNTGFINRHFDNQMIICAPHKITVFYK